MPGDKPVPHWERDFPGRFQAELDDLKAAGAEVTVNDKVLAAEGRLVLDVLWPRPGGKMHLRAIYPDVFPYTRPEVIDIEGRVGRHSSPIAHNLCLLGRGTHTWSQSWTLRRLFDEQLEKCIAAAERPDASEVIFTEEHLGEPVEYWWNTTARPGSYCLIDSAWSISPLVSEGTLKLRCVIDETRAQVPRARALVQEIRAKDGAVLAAWSGPMPELFRDARTLMVPWTRLAKAPIPTGVPADLDIFTKAHPSFQAPRYKLEQFDSHVAATLRAVVYPTELTWRNHGDGWSFGFLFGRKPNQKYMVVPIATYRAGATDIGMRVPAVAALRSATVVVIGGGAIGAPIVLELARNGCKFVRLIEFDHVEPGNTVRWPLGVTAWGEHKGEALRAFIHREYPATRVELEDHRIGACAFKPDEVGTNAVLAKALQDAQLVIDATAEFGVNLIVNKRCRALGIPLITSHATPTLEGGVVARFLYGRGGCRMCLEHAWAAKAIPEPQGEDARDALAQPTGCAERTFHGASFDLTEISLHAVRLAVDTLSDTQRYPATSIVHTVSFVDGHGDARPPAWTTHALSADPKCECQLGPK